VDVPARAFTGQFRDTNRLLGMKNPNDYLPRRTFYQLSMSELSFVKPPVLD
jgi:hypothetical protein